MDSIQDAFISYGRADSKTFATELRQRLIDRGWQVWFDFDSIPLGVDFQAQIREGIERSQNFIFLVSPSSVNSPYCQRELDYALSFNKRVIPLIHVESISREIWKDRFPGETDADWTKFQAAGKDDFRPNLHPALRRINWVYCREGVDDLEASLQQLTTVFERHRDYVASHAQYLVKALYWERHHGESQHLLIAEDLQRADAWLKIKFSEELSPCPPTDLHCEFITESKKNASNLMSQVFLAHAEADSVVMAEVRRSLWREGFTVWSSSTDIVTGTDFQTAIGEGIESADNLVYLLSPDSLKSPYCQQELAYALSLHKRIIPIKVREVVPENLPPCLRDLQYIDLTDNTRPQDYALDESQLYKILRQEASYFENHKLILTKALKWERQHRNPTLLLRGYSLSHGESWLKTARLRSQYPPTSLQEEFIAESLRQPPVAALDGFISYSRADSAFARQLNNNLQQQGKLTWFDQENIPPGVDFQQAIRSGIEASDHFVFIISPSSIRSPFCNEEVEYAHSLNKRIVTVLHRPVDAEDLHPVLAAVQWIDFNRYEGNFSTNFQDLIRTLDTDPDHLHAHTRLLVKAIEWNDRERKDSLLLRGDDLEAAETWLGQSIAKSPYPSELQVEYIRASRIAEDAHQKDIIRTLQAAQAEAQRRIRRGTLYGAVMLLFGVFSGFLGAQAIRFIRTGERDLPGIRWPTLNIVTPADQNQGALMRRFIPSRRVRQDRGLSPRPTALEDLFGFISTPADSLVLADSLVPADSLVLEPPPEIDTTVARASQAVIERLRQSRTVAITQAAGNGATAASSSPPSEPTTATPLGGSAPETREPAAEQAAPRRPDINAMPAGGVPLSFLYDYSGQLVNVMVGAAPQLSPGHGHIVTSVGDRTYIYSPTGQRLGHQQGSRPRFSGDGQRLATTSLAAGKSYIHNLTSGETVLLEGASPTFTADGAAILVKGPDGSSLHYSTEGERLGEFAGEYMGLSVDQQRLLTTTRDGTTYLYDLATADQLAAVEGRNPQFSPDGRRIMTTARNDRQSLVYDVETRQVVATLEGRFPTMSPDGQVILTRARGSDRTYLHSSDHETLAELNGTYRGISPDGNLITSSKEGTSYLYSPGGEFLDEFVGSYPQFSAGGQWLVTTAVEADESYLYSVGGGEPVTLAGAFPSFSFDGETLVTRSRRQNQTYIHSIGGGAITANGAYRGHSVNGFLTTASSGERVRRLVRRHSLTKQHPAKASLKTNGPRRANLASAAAGDAPAVNTTKQLPVSLPLPGSEPPPASAPMVSVQFPGKGRPD